MSRILPSIAALLAGVALAGPVHAQDFDDFRSSYPVTPGQWAGLGDTDDSIKLEAGIRYWYAFGGQDFSDSGGSNLLSSGDTSHIGELHLRIEDHTTKTYAKAIAGYSMAMGGSYSSPMGSGDLVDGHVGYIGADFGWHALGDDNGSGLGMLVGYQYWQDAPNTGRNNFTTLESGDTVNYDTITGQTFIPGDSSPNYVDTHLLRLGVEGKANLGDWFDVSAELAAVPYAKVSGVIGVDDPTFDTTVYNGPAQYPYSGNNGNISFMRSSPTSIDGWGYGAMAEGWLGMHPTENMTFRLGGRAWYLQGTVDQTYTGVQITNPGDTEPDGVYDIDPVVTSGGFIQTVNPFSMFRYGLMAEAAYRF